jgi:hypothetical protein
MARHLQQVAKHDADHGEADECSNGRCVALASSALDRVRAVWPAPGSEDTDLGVLMEPEVGHGETEVYPRVQA